MIAFRLAFVLLALVFADESSGQPGIHVNERPGQMGMLYPRESESRQMKELGGLWMFRADMSSNRKAGFEEKWYANPLEKSGPVIPMAVPSSFNDITQDESLRHFVGWVWYDRTTFVYNSWKNEDLRIVLRFESAHYNTMVWVNGKPAMSHCGGHLPFEAEVNDFLQFGVANRITVAVNNTLNSTTLPPGKIEYQSGPRYPPGYFVQTFQFDFFNYAGIHRPVRFYTTPKVYISDITVVSSLEDGNKGTLRVDSVVVVPTAYRALSVMVRYELYDKKANVVASASGAEMHNATLNVANVNPWWPVGMSDTPGYLYNLKVTASTSDTKDVYNLAVGFRTVKVEKTRFLINDKPFYFKGLNMHEDSEIRGKGFDYPLILKNFNLIKWLGGNSFRTSHYPYAEEIMDMADERGIVVIDECPGIGIRSPNFGPRSLAHHLTVMNELLRRDKNRPSVVMWSVANEPSSNLPVAESYFKTVIDYTKKHDPTRPVTFVTNQDSTVDKAVQFVDVICHNHYYAWYHDSGHLEIIQLQLEYDLRQWFKKFQRPVIQSEYGAGTISGFHANPPLMFTEDYQVATIQQYFPVFDKLRKEFLVGELIWNFADFMTVESVVRVNGNKKGILTRQRQPKPAAHILRGRYLNLTLCESSDKQIGENIV